MSVDPTFDTPFEVGAYMLDVTGRAILQRDVDAFVMRFHLPQVVGTFEGSQRIETRADMIRVFRGVQNFIESEGIDQVIRRTIEAEFLGPDHVTTTHESRYLSKGRYVGDSVVCHSHVHCFDGIWKITDNHYAIENAPLLSHAISGRSLRECYEIARKGPLTVPDPHRTIPPSN